MSSWTNCGWALAIIVFATGAFWMGRFSMPEQSTPEHIEIAPPGAAPVLRPSTPTTGDWGPFALLLVDVQQQFFTADLQTRHPDYSDNVTELLDYCRGKGIEVIHLRTEFASANDLPSSYKIIFGDSPPCLRGSDGVLPASFARELPDERVFYKAAFDGFSVDALTTHLSQGGKRHLLIAGLTSDLCVFSTALGALDKGYIVSIVDDCCQAYSDPAHAFIVHHYGGFLFDTVPHDGILQRRQRWLDQLEFIDRGDPGGRP